MASALPHRPPVEYTPQDRTDIELQQDEPDDVLQTVSSSTAQEILDSLDGNPSTASELADAVGTSIQNVHYHLQQLCEANLVEAVDTWYSSRGTEMTVYALRVKQLVIQFGTVAPDSSTTEGETL